MPDGKRPSYPAGVGLYGSLLIWSSLRQARQYRTIQIPKGKQASYKFGEFHVALRLETAGFTCWSAVHLFRYGKRNQYAEFSTRNTRAVQELWRGASWPSEIQDALAFQPRNPDIVAYHPPKGWLFCEVKRLNDRIKVDQVRALAVLHLLTGAPVAVVRVVPRGGRTKWKVPVAVLEYRSGCQLTWVRLPVR
jgi:hypothetical protein